MIFALNLVAGFFAIVIAASIIGLDRDGFDTKLGAVIRGMAILSLVWLTIYALLGGQS